MAESDTPSRRENKAVQALISAALHVRNTDVTAEEARPYLFGEIALSAEDEAALK
jgi:endonuclease III